MTDESPPPTRRRLAAVVATLAMTAAVASAACSSTASAPTNETASEYTANGGTVSLAFPVKPSMVTDPVSFRGLFPQHSKATAWIFGDLNILKVHSYELALISFKPGTSATEITKELTSYAGPPTTTLYGRPALDEVNAIEGNFSGIVAFSVRETLVIAVGYDSQKTEIQRFLRSLKLVSPKP